MTDNPRTWRCTICGYIHREPQPPEFCPVCGASREEFEPYFEETPAPAITSPVESWRCGICGCTHAGPTPPQECPVCGANKEHFAPTPEEREAARAPKGPARVVVLGAGIAGISAVEALCTASPDTEITLVSRESDLPYYRLNLTRFLAGEVTEKELPLRPEGWYDQRGIRLLRGAEAANLSLGDRNVRLRDGRSLPFEKLVITIGSHPFVPPVPGCSREGVTSLRTMRDALYIREMMERGASAICIGGGILGLEAAAALALRGVRVTLLESHAWLMPRQLNRRAGELLADYARARGITLLTDAHAKEVVGDEHAAGVLLADGTSAHADFIIIAAGIRPNSFLARRAGLLVNQGIVVDDHMRCSRADVFAAGDVAEHRGVLYGLWGPAQYQGSIAGQNAAGLALEFGGIPRSNALKVLGIGMTSVGMIEPGDGSYLVIEEETDGGYYRFLLRDGCLVGAVLLGDTRLSAAAKKAIEERTDLSDLLAGKPTCADVRDRLARKSAMPGEAS